MEICLFLYYYYYYFAKKIFSSQERLALQRQQLRQRLGLSAQGKVFSTGMEHLFDDNDLMTHTVVSPSSGTGMGPEHKKADTNVCMYVQMSVGY